MQTRGYLVDNILAKHGLCLADLNEFGLQLPVSTMLSLFESTQQDHPDPSFGLNFGLQLDISHHGSLGYGILASKTFADVLALTARYCHTRTNLFNVNYTMNHDTVVVTIEERAALGRFLPMIMDVLVACFCTIGEKTLAARGGVHIQLNYAEQPHHVTLQRFGHTLAFNCTHNQFHVPIAALQYPLKSFDPQMAAMATAHCEAEELKLKIEPNLLLEVRTRTAEYLGNSNAFELIANKMHVSPRTLRRRLDALGTNYQNIVEELRQKIAIERLCYSNQTINSIAAELGYQDISNFGRAFKRWTGLSPSAYRLSMAQR